MEDLRSAAPPRSMSELRGRLDGRLITPEHPEYDAARTVLLSAVDRRPAAIVEVASAADVARVVTVARAGGLPLAVRGGGHSFAGHSVCDDGIVIDLRGMRGLDIDPDARTAWAQTGLTTGEYTAAAAAHGLATGFGDAATVGIGGITLAGGIGFLVRKHGMTIDHLLAVEVVTADGDVLLVDEQQHADLFWALRGGGGNFGVVTRLHLRLHEVDRIVGGMLMLPATPEVVAGFVAASEAAPEELSSVANVMVAPPLPFIPAEHHGELVLLAMMVHAGDEETGQRALAPFRELAAPLADMVAPMRYQEMFLEEGPKPAAVTTRPMFLDGVDLAAARTILDRIRSATAPMAVAQIRVLGGAMARVPVEATAFAHRRRRVMIDLAAAYEDAADAAKHETWVAGFATALMEGAGASGGYVGFMSDQDSSHVRDAYPGATWDRLTAIKARYDPTNLFRLNQNIPPAR